MKGYSIPFTPNGNCSMVPTPPWHYVGNVMAVEFEADIEKIKGFLPEGYKVSSNRCSVHFIEWQCSHGEGEGEKWYLDPIRSQYNEAFLLVDVEFNERRGSYCPFIWVDNDIALLRGYIQGWAKQLGSVHMTKYFQLPGKAAPVVGAGGTFAGSCAAKDNRIFDVQVSLKEKTTQLPEPGLVGALCNITLPDLRPGKQDKPLFHQLVDKVNIVDSKISDIWVGDAKLKIHDDYYMDLNYLQPTKVLNGYYYTLSHTIVGQEF